MTWFSLCHNNISNTINFVSFIQRYVLHRRFVVIKAKRNGRLICISLKCTAHIGIRGFRAIYVTRSDRFTSIECGVTWTAHSFPNLDASRPSYSLSRINTLQSWINIYFISHTISSICKNYGFKSPFLNEDLSSFRNFTVDAKIILIRNTMNA